MHETTITHEGARLSIRGSYPDVKAVVGALLGGVPVRDVLGHGWGGRDVTVFAVGGVVEDGGFVHDSRESVVVAPRSEEDIARWLGMSTRRLGKALADGECDGELGELLEQETRSTVRKWIEARMRKVGE